MSQKELVSIGEVCRVTEALAFGHRPSRILPLVELVFGLRGLVVRNLGPNLPVEKIARAAEAHPGAMVGISVSLASGGAGTDRLFAHRRRLTETDRVTTRPQRTCASPSAEQAASSAPSSFPSSPRVATRARPSSVLA